MAYAKTTWNAGAAPGISAARLNHLETQYDAVKTELGNNAGELWAQLKAADGAGSGLDSDKWQGIRWVVPGATAIAAIYLPESPSYAVNGTWADVMKFVLSRPGKYRVTGEYRSGGTTASAIYARLVLNNDGTNKTIASAEASASTGATYVAFSLDMTVALGMGGILTLQAKDTPGYGMRFRNVYVKYSEGSPAPYDANIYVKP